MSVLFLVLTLEVRSAWRFVKVAGSDASTMASERCVTAADNVRSDDMRLAILTLEPLRLTGATLLRMMRLAIRLRFAVISAVLRVVAALGVLRVILVDLGAGALGDSIFTAIREVLRIAAFEVERFLTFTVFGVDRVLTVTVGADRFLTLTVGAADVTLTERCAFGLETEAREDLT